jgi:alpha-galactosidase
VSWQLYDAFGLWPTGYDLHTAEFFAYFLTEETRGGADYGLETRHTTQEEHDAMWARRRALANDASLDELLQPSDEGVIEIIASLLGVSEPACHTLNIPNEGLVDNLPPEMIVELPIYVSSGGARGLKVGPMPQPIAQLLSTRAAQQELLVDAALSGDRRTVLQGLLLDPQITSMEVARSILDESLAANAEWLPAFQG